MDELTIKSFYMRYRLRLLLLLLLIIVFLSIYLVCERNRELLLREAQEDLDELNSRESEALHELECSEQYPAPGIGDLGHTSGWVSMYREDLAELGFTVRWNCEKMEYELYKLVPGQPTPEAMCDCPQ